MIKANGEWKNLINLAFTSTKGLAHKLVLSKYIFWQKCSVAHWHRPVRSEVKLNSCTFEHGKQAIPHLEDQSANIDDQDDVQHEGDYKRTLEQRFARLVVEHSHANCSTEHAEHPHKG